MKALFQNPKAALAYVGITLVGVAMFVGTEDSPGSLHQTVETFGGNDGMTSQDREAQRKFGDPMPDQTIGKSAKSNKPKREREEDLPVVFATDEELMDDASGFDPTPEFFGGFDPNPDDEEGYLSDQDDKDDEQDYGGWASDTQGTKNKDDEGE